MQFFPVQKKSQASAHKCSQVAQAAQQVMTKAPTSPDCGGSPQLGNYCSGILQERFEKQMFPTDYAPDQRGLQAKSRKQEYEMMLGLHF